MIDVTDEMVRVWHDAFNQAAEEAVKADTPLTHTGDIARAALAAVLAIVERDYPLTKPCPSGVGGRCLAATHSASNAGLCCSHGCVYPGATATGS